RLPALLQYVRRGGTLVVFLYGSLIRPQMEALNRLAAPADGLPFLPTTLVDVGRQGQGAVSFAEARYESPLLRLFKDPSVADLTAPRFRRFYVTTEPDRRAVTLLRFEDGTPAAVSRTLGAGTVLMLNFSPAPADSDLARQEIFPPLLH